MGNLRTQIVIPMAGSGQRFRDAGYALPKPLIDVRGKKMIEHVIENLYLSDADILLIAQSKDVTEHPDAFKKLEEKYGCTIVQVKGLTEGAACTVLLAEAHINNDAPLLLANSDQVIDINIQDFLDDAARRSLTGSIMTFEEPGRNPKWSYAAVDASGRVTETKEKIAISTHATVGVYWFKQGRDFVQGAHEMIAANDRCNNEFYVCPVYNYLIKKAKNIGIYDIAPETMHGLGTPEDLKSFLAGF